MKWNSVGKEWLDVADKLDEIKIPVGILYSAKLIQIQMNGIELYKLEGKKFMLINQILQEYYLLPSKGKEVLLVVVKNQKVKWNDIERRKNGLMYSNWLIEFKYELQT